MLSDEERQGLIAQEITKRLQYVDLVEFYKENMGDWLDTWSDDELLELALGE